MVIGIVVNVMENENRKAYAEKHKDEPTIIDLYQEIQTLKQLLKENTIKSDTKN